MPVMVWVLDLDGVVWLGDKPIDGVAEAVARLRSRGERVVFATNNASVELAAQEAKLASFGIPAEGDVVTSAMAGATLVGPDDQVLACGGPGIAEAARRRGAQVVTAQAQAQAQADDDGGPIADVVVAGFDPHFDYGRLRVATQAILRGARFVATNEDATYPTPHGPVPAGGALVAAISYATGVTPIVAGKPHAPMAALIHSLVGGDETSGTVVGDRADTDGAFARALGYQFALVLSGVTTETDLPVDPSPDVIAPDLATLVSEISGNPGWGR
jgi:HAD superfamily hydrolase (TIGR01450 family)